MNARYAYQTAAESEHSGSGTYSSACLKSTDCFGTCDTHLKQLTQLIFGSTAWLQVWKITAIFQVVI